MIPALATPTRTETLEQQRAAFWQAKTKNRELEDGLLWAAHLRWSLEPGNRDRPLSAFFTFWADGREESPGNLINGHDRQRARLAGYSGPLMRLATVGRALRNGLPRPEIDALSTEQLRDSLRTQNLSNLRAGQDALAPALERSRALLKDADPDAPTAPTEADALNLSVLEVLPAAVYRAAVQKAQTGEALELDTLAEATRPPTFGTWAKQRGRCWVCNAVASGGTVLDLHHASYGGLEARTEAHAEVLVGVHRACHINQPFSPRTTAHSRAFAVGNDAAALTRLLEYLTAEHRRYEAWIRGEN